MKMRRGAVEERHRSPIDEMYAAAEPAAPKPGQET